MRRSEKFLLAILLLMLLSWQGWRFAERLVVDPIRRRQAELAQLEEQIAAHQLQLRTLSTAESKVLRWQMRSLPPDPLTAQRLYQQWLTDLAQECGFRSLKVFPDRVTAKNDACVGVLVSIDAEAKLAQLCLFLRRFYRTDLAQQITVLSLDSTQDQGDPVLRVSIMVEGLALCAAEPRQRLFQVGTLVADLSEQATQARIQGPETFSRDAKYVMRIGGEYLDGVRVTETEWTITRGADESTPRQHRQGDLVEFIPLVSAATRQFDVTNLVTRNPFAKPTPKVVQRPPPPQEQPSEIDPAEFTFLVAAFAQDDQRQAWLYDRLNNRNVVIRPGQPFVVAGMEALVETVGNDFIVVYYNDSRWRLRLGKNLRALELLPDDPVP